LQGNLFNYFAANSILELRENPGSENRQKESDKPACWRDFQKTIQTAQKLIVKIKGLILLASLSQTTRGGLKFFYIFQCQELAYETV